MQRRLAKYKQNNTIEKGSLQWIVVVAEAVVV
jgi:hypothetical protein